MKLTNQLTATISLSILATVILIIVGAGVSFYQVGEIYQQRQVDSIVRSVDNSGQLDAPQQQIMGNKLPALLEANSVLKLVILKGETPLYRYDTPQVLSESELSIEYQRSLIEHPELHIQLELRPPLYEVTHTLSSLFWLAGAVALVFIGTLFMLRWLRRQLRGAELLDLRGQYILQDKQNTLQHDPQQEWPSSVSQALDRLLLELEDASKERSRFDTFMRTNVFMDKKLGIGNRAFFDNRLEAMLSDPSSHAGALLIVKLQDVESINYYLGYDRGDEVLSAAAVYLNNFIQRIPGALQARYSGNTFALLLPNVVESEAQDIARQAMSVLRRLHWPDAVHDPAIYIGGVCFRYKESLVQIQEEAELALRSAALQGGEGYFMYYKGITEASMGKGTVRWRTLLTRLLERNLIQLDRQGIYTETNRAPIMYELLARIQDEQGKVLSAGYFIPMAEKCGLSKELDKALVVKTLGYLESDEHKIAMTLNISAANLLARDFYSWLLFELIQRPKSFLNRLVVELSEAQVSRHYQALKKPLRGLKALGCQLAVDQAGQNIVSTEYIQDYNLDYLKLHSSLVRDINAKPANQMAVRSLIGNCVDRATLVIAMGVETQEEWQCLAQQGVYAGQGYLFARPEPLAQLQGTTGSLQSAGV
ncbi:EAL domain-containing protein [Oceanisphaera pacifica]|uniref:EAL domain-containing protein n=1 Tax=Oceanisphaera pacifica TaxID=2818389 RepID=A0ABS3NIN0_9GAMM|nr:EAL domain-containing protein [Oceanisphaera pacifica]MBO1520400.1 EAL domain-containing protein [Oceanisphaera pacifica]